MMISPESFYDMYIKGKTEKEILKQIRSLKREFNLLKKVLEDPYKFDINESPSNTNALFYNRLYLDVAIKGYEELGFKYFKTKKEIKNEEFNEQLNDLKSLSFSIVEKNIKREYKCLINKSFANIYIKVDKKMEYFILSDYMINKLKEINLGECSTKYIYKEETIIINGVEEVMFYPLEKSVEDIEWEINIEFNKYKSKRIIGKDMKFFYFDILEARLLDSHSIRYLQEETALQIAKEAHVNQVDKAGVDYIEHPLYVSSLVDTTEEKIVALLHDVVEDSDMTFEELEKYGFYSHIIDAIKLLTKQSGYDYNEYLSNIKENELARKVKIADLTHNSDITRIRNVNEKDLERQQKYLKAIEYLSS